MSKEEEEKKVPFTQKEAIFRKSQIVNSNDEYYVHYDLILCLRKSKDKNENFPNNNFEGKLTLKFSYNDKNQNDIFLNFEGTIFSLTINSKKIEKIIYKNQRLYLNHSDLILNEINKVEILFSGKYSHSGVGIHHFIDPSDNNEYIYSQSEPNGCSLIFPVFEQPDIKSKLNMTLIGYHDWIMLSNGEEILKWKLENLNSKNEDLDCEKIKEIYDNLSNEEFDFLFKSIYNKNYMITLFKETPKISPYLYCICGGNYYMYTNPFNYKIPLRIFMRQSLKFFGDPKEQFKITIKGMEWYKNYFGISYPYSKYDQIFCPEYNFGAMENVGLVTFNEFYLWEKKPDETKKSKFSITILHELAHMWFGNLVTMIWWDDLWLNESFATFISFLCQKMCLSDCYKNTWIAFNNMKQFGYDKDQMNTTHPVYSIIENTEQSESNFDWIVYYKGSSLLKQMFYCIGYENFSLGLKEYFKKYKWKNSKFDFFVDNMDEAIKKNKKNVLNENEVNFDFDLKDLCKNWLTKAGLNQLKPIFEIENGKIKNFVIEQTPVLEKFNNLQTHIFEIKLLYNNPNEDKIIKVMINPEKITQVKQLENLPEPKGIILNYNDWAYFKWIIDDKTLNYFMEDLNKNLNDVLSRQMVYKSLIDMTKNAVISCQKYFDFILKFLVDENSLEIITNVLRPTIGILKNYLSPKLYENYSDKMFDLIQRLILKNKDNDEFLNLSADYLITYANTEKKLLILKNWLNENKYYIEIDGEKYNLDNKYFTNEMNFTIVSKLYTLNSISLEEKEKILNKQIELDNNSDKSIKAKLRCKAALPDLKIKEEIWEILTKKSKSESLKNMQAYMFGFANMNQLDLVKPFIVDKFFDDIVQLKNMDYFFIEYFVILCGPKNFPTDENIKKLEEVKEKVKDSDICVKYIIDLIDDMKKYQKSHTLCEKSE